VLQVTRALSSGRCDSTRSLGASRINNCLILAHLFSRPPLPSLIHEPKRVAGTPLALSELDHMAAREIMPPGAAFEDRQPAEVSAVETRPTPSGGAAATQETPHLGLLDMASAGAAPAPVGAPEMESQPRQDLGDKVSCAYVHVAAVCMGYPHAVRLVRLLKSMLLHRATPLYLHIVTDLETQVSFETPRRNSESTATPLSPCGSISWPNLTQSATHTHALYLTLGMKFVP